MPTMTDFTEQTKTRYKGVIQSHIKEKATRMMGTADQMRLNPHPRFWKLQLLLMTKKMAGDTIKLKLLHWALNTVHLTAQKRATAESFKKSRLLAALPEVPTQRTGKSLP